MKKILARILICVMVLGLVQIGNTAGTAKAASTDADIYYAVHCQTYGWGLGVAKNGEVTGTSGQAKRLESIKIWVKSELSGSVEYETHVQTYGWSIGAIFTNELDLDCFKTLRLSGRSTLSTILYPVYQDLGEVRAFR